MSQVELTSDELSAICPITGQPDLYQATIEYQPVSLCLESKSLKIYLSRFREQGAFCEALHEARERSDALILNPGAWTHYSWAIRDALEIAAQPAVEVHLSAVDQREEWRRLSVIRELCIGTVSGKGIDGYREALEMLKEALQ